MLKAPFPWFGGKSRVAPLVWERFGEVPNYVEPFLGSAAMLLARPDWSPDVTWIETANDADGMVPNFWRAVQADPEAVAHHADWPSLECDLHARHAWLVGQKEGLQSRLEGDPDYYDAKIAGWWVWGLSQWIGGGFCSGAGPWQQVDGRLVHLGDAGRGVQRKLVHLGTGQGVTRKLVHLGTGQGVTRRLVHLGNAGQGEAGTGAQGLLAWMQALAERFRRVRVCCGDWSRAMGPTPTYKQGLTAVFLDPPYSEAAGRDMGIYATDDGEIAHAVRRWCLENGANPLMRIALCGYTSEHDDLTEAGWTAVGWKAHGGYGLQGYATGRANRHREVVWFSPHCVTPEVAQGRLL